MQVAHNGFWVLDVHGEVVFSTVTVGPARLPRRGWVAAVQSALVSTSHCHIPLPDEDVELEAWRMHSAAVAAADEGAAIALCARPVAPLLQPEPIDPSLIDASLTPRQAEISEYAASGATVGEIASHLGISAETVRSHLKTVYRNLGIANRVELARAMGQRNGDVADVADVA
jgi:DNA-binding CsgD family transcriptional regulator